MTLDTQDNTLQTAVVHLDYIAATRAQAIIRRTAGPAEDDPLACANKAKEVDGTITKTLGVLQENGFYAAVLFLASRKKEEIGRARVTLDEILNLLVALPFGWTKPDTLDSEAVLAHVADTVVCAPLPRLILAKDVCEQMLIYARYGAKARGNDQPEQAGAQADNDQDAAVPLAENVAAQDREDP